MIKDTEKYPKVDRETEETPGGRLLRSAATASANAAERELTAEEIAELERRCLSEGAVDSVGELLVGRGIIDRFQLFNALNESYRRGCSLMEALVKLNYADQDAINRALFLH